MYRDGEAPPHGHVQWRVAVLVGRVEKDVMANEEAEDAHVSHDAGGAGGCPGVVIQGGVAVDRCIGDCR